jgi:hypothetical protein
MFRISAQRPPEKVRFCASPCLRGRRQDSDRSGFEQAALRSARRAKSCVRQSMEEMEICIRSTAFGEPNGKVRVAGSFQCLNWPHFACRSRSAKYQTHRFLSTRISLQLSGNSDPVGTQTTIEAAEIPDTCRDQPAIFSPDGFVNRSTQSGCARCCIILQPDFLGLQGLLPKRGRSSMGICVNARFGADLEATEARNSTLTNPKPEWARIGRLSRLFIRNQVTRSSRNSVPAVC